jgi:hypothetical protein
MSAGFAASYGLFWEKENSKHVPTNIPCSIGYWNALVWLDRFNAGSSLRLMELRLCGFATTTTACSGDANLIFLIELMVEKFQRSVLVLVL